jgi:hypothetical protein
VLWLEWNSKSIEQRAWHLAGEIKSSHTTYDWFQNEVSSDIPKTSYVPRTTSVEMGQVFSWILTQIWRRVHWIWKIDEWLFDTFMHPESECKCVFKTLTWTSSVKGCTLWRRRRLCRWDYLCHIDGKMLLIGAILNQNNRNRNLGFLKDFPALKWISRCTILSIIINWVVVAYYFDCVPDFSFPLNYHFLPLFSFF